MISDEIKHDVIEKVKWCKVRIFRVRQITLPATPIYFDVPGFSAGFAHLPDMSIHLNEFYLNKYTKDVINTTVPHEMCHLVAFYRFGLSATGNNAHGIYWRKEMKEVFGLFPYEYHIYGQEKVWELEKNA